MWVGIDLAAFPTRPSAVAVGSSWTDLLVQTQYGDAEIQALLHTVEKAWVDAPLTQGNGPFRDCDRQLHGLGISLLPITWSSMQKLYRRAVGMKSTLPHVCFYETFPWTLYRWLLQKQSPPLPKRFRKEDGILLLEKWGKEQGLRAQPASVHEWDAIACWVIGWLYEKGEAHAIEGQEGCLWIPA
ncbi:MAG: hypothetical protein N2170_02545 [Bacteroidia bacterium]|nr:hypothetical protein [Bacteroidia bacterium]